MKSIYLFPGQGSQHRGMGEGLFDKYQELVAQADKCLGYSIKELCLEDPDRVLSKTEYTQPALYTVNVLSYLDKLEVESEKPDYVAGHSLGEYCALFAAGAFDFLTGLKLVKKRGALMSQAPKGAMAAIVNIDQAQIEQILANLPYQNIDIANINSRKQIILSGIYDELFATDVQETFTASGASFIPLNVSAAFHSRCMKDIQAQFADYLSTFELQKLKIPVIANYTARPYPNNNYANYLNLQISHPVRWYESISWLIKQGYLNFDEVGPGTVLTKLSDKILQDPLQINDDSPVHAKDLISKLPIDNRSNKSKLIFMYAGQGSQYYQMGRELYYTNTTFKNHMDYCSHEFQSECGSSLVDIIYDESKKGVAFDNILHTHPALYSIGYSLTQVLLEEGFEPSGVLGHSLGEYIAANIAGIISVKDGMQLVIKQAQLLKQECDGGLLSILDTVDTFYQRPDIFAKASLAGVNFSNNFFISGDRDSLEEIHTKLDNEGIISVQLPVRYGFHSDKIELIKEGFLAYASETKTNHPNIPIYSSAYGKELSPHILEHFDTYLWDIVRNEVKFDRLIATAFDAADDHCFVDLSASGTLATFLKYGYGNKYRCVSAINQFGKNTISMNNLRTMLLQSKPPL